jgi:membrane-associated phospholipid phosphatase
MKVEPTHRRTALRLLLAWLLLCAVVVGVGWLLTGPLADSVGAWDDDAARSIADQRTPERDEAAAIGTLVADTVIGLPIGLAVAALLSWRLRSWLPVGFWLVVAAGIQGIYLASVLFVSRDRPPVRILDPGLVPDHSFPSGHVATAMSTYAGIAVLVWWLSRRARPWIALLFLVPLVVGTSRLYEGAHHPTDVLTTLVAATVWLSLVSAVVLGRASVPRREEAGVSPQSTRSPARSRAR